MLGVVKFGTQLVVAAAAVAWLSGCANNGLSNLTAQGQVQTLQQQQTLLAQKNDELQSRASTLDRDNQELESLLAQSRQQSRVLQDQVSALQEQLSTTTSQLAKTREQQQDASSRVEAMTATVRRRAAASISANNSLQQRLPDLSYLGVMSRVDGDVVRVELPGDQLFEPGGARFTPRAGQLIEQVAADVLRAYPNQKIGVEGHTDTDPVQSGGWTSNQQLSVGRAMAVHDYLVSRCRFSPSQIFVVGHGANHPVVSNGTPQGKARNRRVELVVYPEQAPGRGTGG